MSNYSVADAKARLSDLIERAASGEAIVITRHGRPVVELKPVAQIGRPMTLADIEWLKERQIVPRFVDDDPRNIVERMRDEDNERLLRR